MNSWFPARGERWVLEVEIESNLNEEDRSYVHYLPIYMQQPCATRELEKGDFLKLFSPAEGSTDMPLPGSRWVLIVEVLDVDRQAMTVRYHRISPTDEATQDSKTINVHNFRAIYQRKGQTGEMETGADSEWMKERQEWLNAQGAPSPGDLYIMDVRVEKVTGTAGKRVVRYVPVGMPEEASMREMDESFFLKTFECMDGVSPRPGDRWCVVVQVAKYDPEDFMVWYHPVSTDPEKKGAMKRLSDHIFLATFRRVK